MTTKSQNPVAAGGRWCTGRGTGSPAASLQGGLSTRAGAFLWGPQQAKHADLSGVFFLGGGSMMVNTVGQEVVSLQLSCATLFMCFGRDFVFKDIGHRCRNDLLTRRRNTAGSRTPRLRSLLPDVPFHMNPQDPERAHAAAHDPDAALGTEQPRVKLAASTKCNRVQAQPRTCRAPIKSSADMDPFKDLQHSIASTHTKKHRQGQVVGHARCMQSCYAELSPACLEGRASLTDRYSLPLSFLLRLRRGSR